MSVYFCYLVQTAPGINQAVYWLHYGSVKQEIGL